MELEIPTKPREMHAWALAAGAAGKAPCGFVEAGHLDPGVVPFEPNNGQGVARFATSRGLRSDARSWLPRDGGGRSWRRVE